MLAGLADKGAAAFDAEGGRRVGHRLADAAETQQTNAKDRFDGFERFERFERFETFERFDGFRDRWILNGAHGVLISP